MRYYCVTRNVEGNITGVNDDVAMNHPFSFPNEEAQEYFKEYCKRQFEKNHKPRGLFINDFEPFDLESV